MEFGTLIGNMFSDPIVSNAFWAVLGLCILNFVLGSLRAFSNKVFEVTALDAWIRTDVAGRVLPILITLLAAQALPDLSVFGVTGEAALNAFGLAQAAAYIVATLGSIASNVRPPDPVVKSAKTELAIAIGDPIPTA